jgi:transcriptional regulator with XRE-family HTH domain
MITGSQIRAARALVRWSAGELAEKVGLARQTIMRFEQVDSVPPSRTQTLMEIKRVFEEAGLEFIGTPDDGPGVRFKPTSLNLGRLVNVEI